MNKIQIENKLEAYHYMSFLSEAIQKEEDFKYTAIHQLGARLSGKTTSDNIELVRAVLGAYRKKVSLVAFIFRMRHKDTQEAGNDILQLFIKYKMPIIINKGRRLIRVGNSKIFM